MRRWWRTRQDRDGGEVGIADGDGDGRVNVLALALGHGELRPTTHGTTPLYFAQSEQESETRARAREGRQGDGKGAAGGRPTREEARGGQDSRWKVDGRRRRRKGGNEMRSVFSSSVPPASARANARDVR